MTLILSCEQECFAQWGLYSLKQPGACSLEILLLNMKESGHHLGSQCQMELSHKHGNHCGHIDLGQLLPHAVPTRGARDSSDLCTTACSGCSYMVYRKHRALQTCVLHNGRSAVLLEGLDLSNTYSASAECCTAQQCDLCRT